MGAKVKESLKAIIVNKRPSLIESIQLKLPKLGVKDIDKVGRTKPVKDVEKEGGEMEARTKSNKL